MLVVLNKPTYRLMVHHKKRSSYYYGNHENSPYRYDDIRLLRKPYEKDERVIRLGSVNVSDKIFNFF